MFAFLPRAHFVGCGPLQRAKSFYFQISSGVAVLCQQFGHEAIWILGSLEIKTQQQNSPSTNHCLYTGKMETSASHLKLSKIEDQRIQGVYDAHKKTDHTKANLFFF